MLSCRTYSLIILLNSSVDKNFIIALLLLELQKMVLAAVVLPLPEGMTVSGAPVRALRNTLFPVLTGPVIHTSISSFAILFAMASK